MAHNIWYVNINVNPVSHENRVKLDRDKSTRTNEPEI